MIKRVLTVVLLVTATLPAWAVEVKLKWQPGKSYLFQNSVNSTVAVPLPGQGPVETQSTMEMKVRNVASEHEKGVKVAVAFEGIRMKTAMQGIVVEYDSEDPAKQGGLLGGVFAGLAGAKYSAIYGEDGDIVEFEGLDQVQAPGQMGFGKAELEAMTRQSAQFAPNKDVKVGETWTSEVTMPMSGLGKDVTLIYTFKLEKVEEREGRTLAVISLTGKAKDGDGGEDAETVLTVNTKKLTGEVLWDVELGQPFQITTDAELEMGVPAGAPQEAGAPGKMPVKSRSVQKLLKVE